MTLNDKIEEVVKEFGDYADYATEAAFQEKLRSSLRKIVEETLEETRVEGDKQFGSVKMNYGELKALTEGWNAALQAKEAKEREYLS